MKWEHGRFGDGFDLILRSKAQCIRRLPAPIAILGTKAERMAKNPILIPEPGLHSYELGPFWLVKDPPPVLEGSRLFWCSKPPGFSLPPSSERRGRRGGSRTGDIVGGKQTLRSPTRT